MQFNSLWIFKIHLGDIQVGSITFLVIFFLKGFSWFIDEFITDSAFVIIVLWYLSLEQIPFVDDGNFLLFATVVNSNSNNRRIEPDNYYRNQDRCKQKRFLFYTGKVFPLNYQPDLVHCRCLSGECLELATVGSAFDQLDEDVVQRRKYFIKSRNTGILLKKIFQNIIGRETNIDLYD